MNVSAGAERPASQIELQMSALSGTVAQLTELCERLEEKLGRIATPANQAQPAEEKTAESVVPHAADLREINSRVASVNMFLVELITGRIQL